MEYSYTGEISDYTLIYLNSRWYDTSIRRFVSQDSYNLLNRYSYVEGNPINKTDHSGHKSVLDIKNFNKAFSYINIALSVPLLDPVSLTLGLFNELGHHNKIITYINYSWAVFNISRLIGASMFAYMRVSADTEVDGYVFIERNVLKDTHEAQDSTVVRSYSLVDEKDKVTSNLMLNKSVVYRDVRTASLYENNLPRNMTLDKGSYSLKSIESAGSFSEEESYIERPERNKSILELWKVDINGAYDGKP